MGQVTELEEGSFANIESIFMVVDFLWKSAQLAQAQSILQFAYLVPRTLKIWEHIEKKCNSGAILTIL
jgi:hypothetical protein